MTDSLLSSDWDLVTSLLPRDWRESARQCGAMRRGRNVADPEMLLRLIFLHVAGGLSLRQTVARSQALGWAQLSDVALLKRLRGAANWLEYLCSGLWQEPGWPWPNSQWVAQRTWRIIDATGVQEPGSVGSNWRLHYSIRLPSLACDFVALSEEHGGESLLRLPIHAQDVVLADRGYSRRPGVAWVLEHGADVIVRHHPDAFPLLDPQGQAWDVLAAVRSLEGHQPRSWPAQFEHQGRRWPLWLCAVRKSEAATERARVKLRQEYGPKVSPQSLEWAGYVSVLCSLPPEKLSPLQVLGWYRGRWQIELVFKTLKGLLELGEVPKYDASSAQAWLQAKLLTALLVHRLEQEANFFSPWGFPLERAVGMAGV